MTAQSSLPLEESVCVQDICVGGTDAEPEEEGARQESSGHEEASPQESTSTETGAASTEDASSDEGASGDDPAPAAEGPSGFPDMESVSNEMAEDLQTQGLQLMELLASFAAALALAVTAAWGPAQVMYARIAQRLAWLSILPIAFLFSRIHSDKVLDQPIRAHLMQMIESSPGTDVDALRQGAGVAWSTARHHLRHLENHGLVRSTRSGGHLLYFAAGTGASHDRRSLAVLRGATREHVAKTILHHPGITNGDIARRLGLSRPSVTHHLRALQKAGLLATEKAGRQIRITAMPRLTDLMDRRPSSSHAPRMAMHAAPAPAGAMA